MKHKIIDIGVASRIGAYSDAIEVQPNLRWMTTSGTPGLASEGRAGLPKDITRQAELAWAHITRALEKANMGVRKNRPAVEPSGGRVE